MPLTKQEIMALTAQQLRDMSQDEALAARNQQDVYWDQDVQNKLAPAEHRAFVREVSEISPLAGLVVGGPMNAVYSAGKALQQYKGLDPKLLIAQKTLGPLLDKYTVGRSTNNLEGFVEGAKGVLDPTILSKALRSPLSYKDVVSSTIPPSTAGKFQR